MDEPTTRPVPCFDTWIKSSLLGVGHLDDAPAMMDLISGYGATYDRIIGTDPSTALDSTGVEARRDLVDKTLAEADLCIAEIRRLLTDYMDPTIDKALSDARDALSRYIEVYPSLSSVTLRRDATEAVMAIHGAAERKRIRLRNAQGYDLGAYPKGSRQGKLARQRAALHESEAAEERSL